MANVQPNPDELARRFFDLAILGVLTCIGVIIALMSIGY
jgi:hypothetical protein